MKNISISLNVLLLVAVAFLYYKQFSGEKKSSSPATVTVADSSAISSKTPAIVPVINNAPKDVRIVFVNADSIFAKYDYAKKTKAAGDARVANYQKTYQDKAAAFQKDYNDYMEKAGAGGYTKEQGTAIEASLQKRRDEIVEMQQNQDKVLGDVEKTNADVQKSIYDYLTRFNKEHGYYCTLAYTKTGSGVLGIDRSSGRTEIRGASTREFDMANPNKEGTWDGQTYHEPLSHGRVFTPGQIWENYTYFIKQVAPVAEEQNVRIGIHPDDPPVPVLAGVPRCIFASFEGYKRALEIANSPNVGICLCCGTWLEGGRKLTGKDPEEMIRYFGASKIWKIHFRNVSAPLPHFVETFMDDGYYDMWKIMKALRDVNFDGIVILDHSPMLVGNTYTQTAYGVAYMRALLNRANAAAES